MITSAILYRQPLGQIRSLVPKELFAIKAKTLIQALPFYGQPLLELLKETLLEVHVETRDEALFVKENGLVPFDGGRDCVTRKEVVDLSAPPDRLRCLNWDPESGPCFCFENSPESNDEDIIWKLRVSRRAPRWAFGKLEFLDFAIRDGFSIRKVHDMWPKETFNVPGDLAIIAKSHYQNKLGVIRATSWTNDEMETLRELGIPLFVPNEECICCLLDFEEDKITEELVCGHMVHSACVEGCSTLKCYCGVSSSRGDDSDDEQALYWEERAWEMEFIREEEMYYSERRRARNRSAGTAAAAITQ